MLSKRRRKKEEKPENIQIGKVWKTIPVEISTSEFFLNSVKINMMIDDGACTTLIDSNLADEIGFKGKSMNLKSKNVFNDENIQNCTKGIIYAKPIGKEDIIEIDVLSCNMNQTIKPVPPKLLKSKFKSMKKLPLLEPAEGNVKLLLGFDHQHLIRVLRTFVTKPDEPYCVETIWGCTVLYHPESTKRARRNTTSESYA